MEFRHFTRQRWEALWLSLGANAPAGSFDNILERYSEPHRAYHGAKHIERCLAQFDTLKSLAERPDLVELALWHHDVIYDTSARDNEARSGEFARSLLQQAGIETVADEVVDMIMATTHQDVPPVGDAALVSDIDLSILGADQHEYDAYTLEVRQEYSWVPEDAFRAGRLKVLGSIFSGGTLFHHKDCSDLWEAKAQQNFRRERHQLLQSS